MKGDKAAGMMPEEGLPGQAFDGELLSLDLAQCGRHKIMGQN